MDKKNVRLIKAIANMSGWWYTNRSQINVVVVRGIWEMAEEGIKCSSCGTMYNKMFLMGKQGNADICPLCGGKLEDEEEHPDWITWYYYGHRSDNGKTASLRDKPIDLEEHGDIFFLIKEFKAPPESECGLDEVKRILRTYVPDAFVYKQEAEKIVTCPRCLSKEIQLVPRKFSLLTGFATNKYDRMCVRCKKRL